MKRAAIFLVLILLSLGIQSQTAVPKAQSMFIYNFSRLVEWPAEDKTGDFVIGVLGNSDVFSELEAYCAGKKVGLQSISVKKYKEMAEIQKCHILFVSYGKSGAMTEVISKIGTNHTLIIGEKKGVIETGAAINFIINEDKLKFELKTGNATKYSLKINSKLEEMAIVIN